MRNLILAALLFTSSALSLKAGALMTIDAELKKVWPSNRTVNIVFHGHSVPSGYHLAAEVKPFESYPHLFRVLLNKRYPFAVCNVITTSIGGEHSIAGAARFKSDALSLKPDLVFIDYALNDRSQPLAAVENAWRSMVNAAKAANVPVVLITPTGASDADLSNPKDPLTERVELIRSIAKSERVMLADVSADWLAALQAGTVQKTLLSQGNHPNLAGHTLAARTIFSTFSSATGYLTLRAGDVPRDRSTNTYTSPDGELSLTTTNRFSGRGDFLGDSGGKANRVETYDGNESLRVTLSPATQLYSMGMRYTEAKIKIHGFASDPVARIGTVNAAPGKVVWDGENKTLTLAIPWDDNRRRQVTFTNPAASNGRTRTFLFSKNEARIPQAAFTDITYQTIKP